jgi:hypothetical protein
MTVFKIQTFLDAVSMYDNIQTFTPDYVWSVAKMWRRWYFPWPRIEVGVVKNLRPAELKAARMAILNARIRFRKEKARVMRVTQVSGVETKTVVWDNGKYLDPTILPWYWRILRWFITPSKTKAKKTEKASEKKPEKKK